MKRILIAFPISSDIIQIAQKEFALTHQGSTPMNVDQVVQAASELNIEAIMVSPAQKMDAALIAKLPASVKVIATCSVGFDHLDVRAGHARNIVMTNTPDVLTDATADLAMLLLLGACRRGREYLQVMESGWGKSFGQNEMLGIDPGGKNLGIIGMGRIGQAVAKRARAFGMKILYSNRNRLSPELEQGAEYYADFRDMLPKTQILSLHAPDTHETQKIINRETLSLMPKKSVLVNVARGSLVDEEALIDALKSGQLFAAGLDVFNGEPKYDRRLWDLQNTFLTPHMGSATIETRNAMGERALANMRQVLAGEPPRDLLS